MYVHIGGKVYAAAINVQINFIKVQNRNTVCTHTLNNVK